MNTGFCQTPNMYAAKPTCSYDEKDGVITVGGYQRYSFRPGDNSIRSDDMRLVLLEPYLDSGMFANREVLDLGSNGGLFSIAAVAAGARHITAVDMDGDYIELLQQILRMLPQSYQQTIRPDHKLIPRVSTQSDIVLAFALVHWLYSCTAGYGSLGAIIEFLQSLTRDMLFIEWVDPQDIAITNFKHTSRNKKLIKGEYDFTTFLDALRGRFSWVSKLGLTGVARSLYLARRGNTGATSRIYIDRLGDRAIKTITNNFGIETLIDNELRWLGKLSPFKQFPDVVSASGAGGVGCIQMNYCGEPIRRNNIPPDWRKQADEILSILRSIHCSHNDIKASDVLVHNGKLRLVDFGWASPLGEPLPGHWPQLEATITHNDEIDLVNAIIGVQQ